MKVTSIKLQVKDPERVSIFVDGKYSFSLSLSELATEKIKNNQDLGETDLKRLKRISEDGKLKARALRWLLMRPHSTREFIDYMKRKKADPQLTEACVEEFTRRKYLDDAAFAEWFSDNRIRKNKSNRAVRAELLKKGIDGETINHVIDEAASEEERLKFVIKKKQNSSRYKNDPLKLAKYLTSQGFNYHLVKKNLLDNTSED